MNTPYTIRPLDWDRTAGNRSHAATLLGDADVEFKQDEPHSYGRFVWMFSQYTAWMPCESMEDGERKAEAMYQQKLIEGALTLTDQGILE